MQPSKLRAAGLVLLAFGPFGAGLPGAASAADAKAGAATAKQWCTSCHTVSASSGTGRDTAPPFARIAGRPDFDAEALRAFLANPHPPMKELNLTRSEIDNLVAYIETLKPGK